MGEPFASPRTVRLRFWEPLLLHFPVRAAQACAGIGHVAQATSLAQLRVLGTLRVGEGVLRPWGEPSLSVHLALPAPLVSKVVYVKIKPLKFRRVCVFVKTPQLPEDRRPAPPRGSGPRLLLPGRSESAGGGGTAADSAGIGAKAASPLAPVPPLDPPMTS